MSFAPVAFFIFNRPDHTRQTLEALAKNVGAIETDLIVIADGPRPTCTEAQRQKVYETQEIAKTFKGFKSVTLIANENNLGLKLNVVTGINKVFEKFERVIVLEDDIVTSPYFLKYCNEGLDLYANDQNVYSICAYQHPIEFPEIDTFLAPFISSWGWATWTGKFAIKEPSAKEQQIIRDEIWMSYRFNLGHFNYDHMFKNQKSWAILWYFNVFMRNGVSVFPTRSLVYNIGHDGSGENCGSYYVGPQVLNEPLLHQHKETLDLKKLALYYNHFNIQKDPTLFRRGINKMKRIIRKYQS